MREAADWSGELAQGLAERRGAFHALEARLEASEAEEARALLADLERAAQRARPAGVVALVGPTGAGKSSLFNALVGEPASEVSPLRPTTRGLIAAEPVPGLARELLGEALCSRTEVRRVPALEAFEAPVVLVDGPDHNSHAPGHRELSCQLVERADLLLVVTHPQGIVELAGLSFLARFLGRRRVVGVLGHVEEHATEDREALLLQLRDMLTEVLGQAPAAVLPVDGRRSGDGSPAGGGSSPGEGGTDAQWASLQAALVRELRAGALGRLLQANAVGAEERLASLAQRVRARLEAHEQELTRAMEGALERWQVGLALRVRGAVEATAGGWSSLSRKGLAEGVRGLGGALLRRSWAQLGALVTGGLLLRRSPLVGAGVLAAGSLASKQSPKAPVGDGLLSEAELGEVGRLGAAASGEDEVEAWVERSRCAIQAAQASWEATRNAGASRAGLLLARGLLEVPLALLALRGVALALLGLLGGPGFGLDGLVDTLVVGAAWAMAWRASMGLLSERGARSAQARLLACVARASAEEAGRVRAQRRATGEELRAALASLAGAS
jgi:energy-coupling factor transporter ATP-binding protein EcfA2